MMAIASRPARALMRPTRAQPRPAASPSRRARRRSAFQRDRDRIIHSTAFRRLKHKTQVFVFHEGDHYRTRLTHTLEVHADRPLARPRARARRGSRRGAGAGPRSRPPAVRPCRRARARPMPGGLRRLRPQRPDAARRDRAGAALCRLRRAQPHLGDARRAGQAQRPADRPRRPCRSAATPSAACRARSATIRRAARSRALELCRAPRRRPRRSPTTSPMTPMISTTACAPGCSALDDLAAVPLLGEILREIARSAIRRSTPCAPAHELMRRLITRDDRGRDRANRQRPHRRAGAALDADDVRSAAAPVVAFSAAMARGRTRHQGFSVSAHVSPCARHAGHGRGRAAWCATCSRAISARSARHAGGLARRARAGRRARRARAGSPISSPA